MRDCELTKHDTREDDLTSSSKRSRLVRYLGLNDVKTSPSSSDSSFLFCPRLSSFCLDDLASWEMGLALNAVIVASMPDLKCARLSGSKSLFGCLKLSCRDQKTGYRASASSDFAVDESLFSLKETVLLGA